MRVFVLVAVAGILAGVSTPVSAALAVSCGNPGSTVVTVTGAVAGAKVVLMGASHERPDVDRRLVRREWIGIANSSGTAVFDMDPANPGTVTVPAHSMWVAVDLSAGASASVVPPGSPNRHVQYQEPPTMRPSAGQSFISDERSLLALLVARKGTGGGAWVRTCGDGADGDGETPVGGVVPVNGIIKVLLSGLQPVGSSPTTPPATLATGDVVIGMDLYTLEYWILVI
jgi:hypothetical protein